MTLIAHLSDLHFGKVDEALVAAVLADMRKLRPDLCVISGDLTQRALSRQFRQARAFLDDLPGAWLAVPGNHDLPSFDLVGRLLRPHRGWRRHIDADLSPRWSDGRVAVLGINTARRLNRRLNFAHGRISALQVRLARQALYPDLPDLVRIVVAHHPFLAPEEAPRTRLASRAAMALTSFAAAQVDLLLVGHLHRNYLQGAQMEAGGEERPIYVLHAGTATSTRTREEPNGYNLLQVGPDDVQIAVRLWRDGGFVETERHRLLRTAGGLVLAPGDRVPRIGEAEAAAV